MRGSSKRVPSPPLSSAATRSCFSANLCTTLFAKQSTLHQFPLLLRPAGETERRRCFCFVALRSRHSRVQLQRRREHCVFLRNATSVPSEWWGTKGKHASFCCHGVAKVPAINPPRAATCGGLLKCTLELGCVSSEFTSRVRLVRVKKVLS